MAYLFVLLSYLLGSIPFGLLFAKTAGLDIRQAGSGNIGATNVNRLLGKKLGLLTLLADTGKGLLPLLAADGLLAAALPDRQLWVLACGAAAFLGHLFPLYLRFKGGKGVATALGIFLFLRPEAAVISMAIFAGVVRIGGYVSLGSICAAAAMPCLIWLLAGSTPDLGLALLVALLIWIKHSANIRRLLKGEEKGWKTSPPPPSGPASS